MPAHNFAMGIALEKSSASCARAYLNKEMINI